MLVKAAYGTNAEIAARETGANAAGVQYVAPVYEYSRFGNSINYSIKVLVDRQNTLGEGVPRTGNLALRVEMYSPEASDPVLSLIPLDDEDNAIAEIATNTNYSRIRWYVIDIYNAENSWNTATARTRDVYKRQIRGTEGNVSVRCSGKGISADAEDRRKYLKELLFRCDDADCRRAL